MERNEEMEYAMKRLRSWATPLTVGSFLIMGVTGILMFFHLDSGVNKLVHEWAGWVMVAGVAAHLVLNWRAFSTYFKRPLAVGIIGVGAAVLALSFAPLAGAGGGSPVPMVMGAIGHADIGTIIALSGQDLETELIRLADAGFDANAGTPMQTLTGGDRDAQNAVLAVLFAP